MTPRLESADYVSGHILHLQFADGVEGDVDFSDELWGEVFEPLNDPKAFRQFHVDHELNTITWASGADFAPEFLYEKAAERVLGNTGHRSP